MKVFLLLQKVLNISQWSIVTKKSENEFLRDKHCVSRTNKALSTINYKLNDHQCQRLEMNFFFFEKDRTYITIAQSFKYS